MKTNSWALAFFVGTIGLTGCRRTADTPSAGLTNDSAASLKTLEQGWNNNTREGFWFTPQGAQVMPYDWFLSLERTNSTELIRSSANIERLRYIPMPKSRLNPDGLPLGFSKDQDPDTRKNYLGLTCAACHTAKLDLQGTPVIIDGAPTLADFKSFLTEVTVSLRQTLTDPVKFQRFANAVLGPSPSATSHAQLRTNLEQGTQALEQRRANDHTDVAYGFSRLDAFGGILNNVAANDLKMNSNAAPPDAPVSYPFIWDAPQADRVQWNGAALNAPVIGGLIRNVGEVLGVFGRLNIKPAGALSLNKGFDNSVNLENLGQLEIWLRELWSPTWPTQYLPAINQEMAMRGQAIYQRDCQSCHSILDSRNPARTFNAVMTPVAEVGTDPTMAKNYLERRAKTGILEGQKLMIVSGPKFGPEARSFEIVIHGVTGVLLKHPIRALKVGIEDVKHAKALARLGTPTDAASEDESGALNQMVKRIEDYAERLKLFDATTSSYKARPLNGIWATAPYLHNGSVPNLWELLKTKSQRVAKFHVGSRSFDSKNVGLNSQPSPGSFEFDASLHGNSNAGHEYGAALKDAEKWDLIEYLKTL